MKYLTLLIVMVLLFKTQIFAFEKVGTTSFQFLKVVADARSTAMAGAYTAVVDHSDAVFWNPAALTRVQGTDFNFSYMNYFLDVKHFSASASFNLADLGHIGLLAMLADYGKIDVTSVNALGFVGNVYNPGLTGQVINPNAIVFGVSYAKKLTNKFAFGLTAKFVREDMDFQSPYAGSNHNYQVYHNALMFDTGLLYDTGFRSVKISAVIRHFGAEVKYIDQSYPLPQMMNIGIAAQVFGPQSALWFTTASQKLTIAADLVQPRDYDQQYNVGMEYSFQNTIFLRGGYRINYDTEGLTLGFGLKFKNYRVDYSYCDYGTFLQTVHRFSLGINLK